MGGLGEQGEELEEEVRIERGRIGKVAGGEGGGYPIGEMYSMSCLAVVV